jgi:hypothetical protein
MTSERKGILEKERKSMIEKKIPEILDEPLLTPVEEDQIIADQLESQLQRRVLGRYAALPRWASW